MIRQGGTLYHIDEFCDVCTQMAYVAEYKQEDIMELTRRSFLATTGITAAGISTCLAQNTAAAFAEENPQAEPAHNPIAVEEVDILVAGSGTAGTCAALRAAELGAHVLCIEKNPVLMGTSMFAEGFAGVGSKTQAEMGIQIDPAMVVADAMNYHHCAANGPVIRAMVYNSGETIDWITEKGIAWAAVAALGQSYQTWHLPLGEMGPTHVLDVLEVLQAAAVEAGAEFRTDTPMTGLVVENNKVCGVYANTADGEIQINAKAVILATGGWANNKEMFERLTSKPYDNFIVWGMTGRDGDGITYAVEQAGAALHHPEAVMWHTGALKDTNAFSDIPNYTLLMQPTLHVNENAQRYFNEAFTSDFTACGNALASQGANYVIIDDAYINHIETVGPWMPMPNLGAFPGQPFACREGIESASGLVKADTIEELAQKLGLDADALAKTVDAYNSYCETGVDLEYGKPADMLLPVATAPFYGGKVTPTLFTTVGGLKVNEMMQVVNEAGMAIEGLYAVGGDANGMYGSNYDVDVMSGGQQGWCATSGRLAAQYALA